MNKHGPILVIEDDMDDQQVLTMVFEQLECPNEIVFLRSGDEAIAHLVQPHIFPFMVLCDINLPKMNGYEVKQKVCSVGALRQKCVPFLFFSTAANDSHARDAYEQSVQGFFIKPTSYETLLDTMRVILQYWNMCYAPTRSGNAG